MAYLGKNPVDFNDVVESQKFTVTGDLTVDTNTLFVDASADAVGIGLTDPDTPLEIQRSSSGNALKLSSSTDGASVFLAFEHQESGTKHVRGRIRAASNGVEGGLIFETGASSSTSERMRITSDGDGLFNTTSVIQSAILSVKGNASRNGITSQVTNNAFFSFIAANASGSITFYVRGDGVVVAPTVYNSVVSSNLRDLQISDSGFLGYATSTRASKGNIKNLEDVSWLSKLNPVTFNRKAVDTDTNTFKDELLSETEYGLIAEDVEAVNKNLCFYNETEDGQELAGITYSKLITPLIKALQEANAKIETLEARIEALENA